MKCYIIKSGTEYIADVTRPIRVRYYDGVQIQDTEHPDEAKHYKNKSAAVNWLSKTLKSMQAERDEAFTKYKDNQGNGSRWYTDLYKKRYESMDIILKWLSKATVEPLDIEVPNHMKKNKIKWDDWRVQCNEQGKAHISLDILGTARYSCKCCGIKLKNIPFYNIYDGNGCRICIPCLYIRMDNIKAAFEGMDEEYRTDITNELILGGM